jgi:hypothetical protein
MKVLNAAGCVLEWRITTQFAIELAVQHEASIMPDSRLIDVPRSPHSRVNLVPAGETASASGTPCFPVWSFGSSGTRTRSTQAQLAFAIGRRGR